ncbi:unnamed protein product [Chironomus riparius]|uniref:Odorant receptor n=1 Tax=Chironomus riparius TaxID=315576 RepID=A0A9N9RYJ4_9DIPT|nr:unnamed protein product [Chironomus riparius]
MDQDFVLKITKQYFYTAGFYLMPFKPSNRSGYLKMVLKKIQFVFGIGSILTAASLCALYIYFNLSDMKNIFEGLSNINLLTITAFKALIIWWKHEPILEVLRKLKLENDEKRSKKYLKGSLKFFHPYQKFSFILFATTLIGFVLASIVRNFSLGPDEKSLIYKIYLPFDYQPMVIYIITQIWSEFVGFSCAFLQVACDGLFFGILIMLSSEFNELSDVLINLDYKKDHLQLRNCAIKHQELLQINKEIEAIFSLSTFLTFVDSSLTICFATLECFIGQEEWLKYVTFVLYAAIILNHIFFYCFFCQQLHDANSNIGEQIIMGNWYESNDKRVLTSVHLILMKSQQIVKLTALNFTVITINSFSNTMRTEVQQVRIIDNLLLLQESSKWVL